MVSHTKVKKILSVVIPLIISLILVVSFVILPAQADEPPQEIEKLQQWVYDQGYNYMVAENWITQLSPEEREALCGYKQVEAPKEPLPENLGFFSNVPKAGSQKFGVPPASYDAMALGYVTPIKNQSSPFLCGSCWIHAAIADFESDVAIGESSLLDFSEQEAGDCNIWSTVGGYNFCQGGIALMTTNYFTKYGSADETCHPYAATPESCYNCPLLRNVDNWRMITGSDGNESKHINTIKNAILNYGPVYSSIYASGPGFGTYSSGVYEYWGPGTPDHAIEIIGWDDTLSHSMGDGAWMIKNSWGTDWGAGGPYPGCAWVAYGAANLGDDTSAICGYENPPDTIFYHDECGWMGWFMGDGVNPTLYGAVRFTPTQDMTLTAVDFWAVDVNMNYEIKIFGTLTDSGGGNYAFSSQLGTTQTGSTNEMGYYSIPLSTPVPLTGGDDFIVQVKLTTSTLGHFWPMPIDYYTAISHPWLPAWSGIATFSNESYVSSDEAQFVKPSPYDVGIRARAVGLEFGDAPDPTYPSLLANDGARHNPTATEILGLASSPDSKDFELDAKVPDLDLFDDGLLTTTIGTNNPSQTVTFEVTDFMAPSSNLRVNILIDLNADGDWNDIVGSQSEHVVQNQLIAPSAAEQVVVSTPFSTVGATLGPTWLRITLTRDDIQNLPWDGTMSGHAPMTPFEYGETEDWEITLTEEAPDITVDPTSFEVTLPSDTTWDDTLTIGNVGDAALTYDISDEETTAGTASITRTYELTTADEIDPSSGAKPTGQLTCEVGYSGLMDGLNILVLGTAACPLVDDEVARLNALGASTVLVEDDAIAALTQADLELYDVVYLAVGWGAASTHIEAIGDMIKTYVGNGGGLVVGQCNPTSVPYTPGFLPYSLTYADTWYPACGVTIIVPTHYITSGLTGDDMPEVYDRVPLATLDANYDLLAKSSVEEVLSLAVAEYGGGRIAVHTSLWCGSGTECGGDPDIIIERIFYWTAQGAGPGDCPWLDESPTSGSVAAGAPDDSITVSIDTTGLGAGNYSANIVIANNDPDGNPTIVPVTLNVVGDGLMEGDASQNGCVSIGDAMFIAQYRFGLRSFSADQLECADTTDNGSITMGDAMHIAQWLFDPDGSGGILFEPLWKSPDDDHMLPPQRC